MYWITNHFLLMLSKTLLESYKLKFFEKFSDITNFEERVHAGKNLLRSRKPELSSLESVFT